MKSISVLELSGVCNLKCSYCVYPTMEKAKGYMNRETLHQAIKHLKHTNTKKVALHHFGEPLMHPNLVEFVNKISNVVCETYFYTNGIFLTREIAKDLKNAGLSYFYVSLHKPEVEKKAIEVIKGLNIFKGFVRDVNSYGHNYAGKVNREVKSMQNRICPFIYKQVGVIRWNGDFTNCCIDSTNSNILGNVWENNVEDIQIKPFELCKTCHFKYKNFNIWDIMDSHKNELIRSSIEFFKKYNLPKKLLDFLRKSHST